MFYLPVDELASPTTTTATATTTTTETTATTTTTSPSVIVTGVNVIEGHGGDEKSQSSLSTGECVQRIQDEFHRYVC